MHAERGRSLLTAAPSVANATGVTKETSPRFEYLVIFLCLDVL
jgi:hypothetical protein